MFRSMRFGLVLAASMSTLVFTVAAQASTDQTFATGDPGYRNSVIVSYSADYDRAFDLAPLALFKEQPVAITQRGYHVTKPLAIKTHAFGAAVLATSKAGWGSGRLRKLAG
jgi:hypothetical protein